MSSTAEIIKFPVHPDNPVGKRRTRPFTRLDNEHDLLPLLALPEWLVKPALYLISRRELRDPSITWREVAGVADISRPQAFRVLKALKDRGFATSAEDGRWAWNCHRTVSPMRLNPTPPSLTHETRQSHQTRKPVSPMRLIAPKIDVPHDEKDPSELKGIKEEQKKNRGGDEMSTDRSAEYRAALRAVADAGLLDVWGNWVALGRLTRPTQEAQIAQWASWVGEGRADALRAEARHIIESGSYSSPFAALKKRISVQGSKLQPLTTDNGSAGRPALREGQRVRYPDGSEALILAIRARGVTTDHPNYPDVPLGQVKTLTVVP